MSKYDPEHEPEKFFAISWLCEACFAEGNNADWQVTKGRCPKCGEKRVSRTASVLRSVKTGVISWGGDYWCDMCADSLLPGVLFPWDQDIGHAGVERCDMCSIYEYDDDAAAALQKLLGEEFVVASYQVGEDPNAAGAMRFAVFPAGSGQAPLTFDEGRALWYKLAAPELAKARISQRRLPLLRAKPKEK